jgi:hypothetical protein
MLEPGVYHVRIVARYTVGKTWRDRLTDSLHVLFLGGQLDGVEVVVAETELFRSRFGEVAPVDVDRLADEILRPASEMIIDGHAIEVVQPRKGLDSAHE